MNKVDSKKLWYQCLKYLLFFALFFVLHMAELQGLHPFAFGMLFALVWCNQKLLLLAPIYILSGLLAHFSIHSLIILSCTVLVFAFFYFLHLRIKKPLNPLLVGVYAFLSQFAFLYLNSGSTESIISAGISVFLGLVAMYAYLYFMQSVLVRGLRRHYTIDEVVSLGILVLAIGVGLASIPDFAGIISRAILVFLVLCLVWVLNAGASISLSVVLGVGVALASNEVSMLCVLTLGALVANALKSRNKFFGCAGLVLADVFVSLYFFNFYSAFLLLGTLSGVFLFLLIPQSSLQKLNTFIIADEDDFALRNIITRSRSALYRRIWGVSEVFREMQSVFIQMARGVLSPKLATEFLVEEIKKKVCQQCVMKSSCLRVDIKQTNADIEKLVALAFARGKVNVLDLPPSLSAKCQRVNVIINTVNSVVAEYSQYARMVTGMDASRLLIGDQLFGVSQILRSLAEEVNLNISFDTQKEQKLIEDLMYNRILCSEAVVYCRSAGSSEVTLVIRTADSTREEIGEVTSRVLSSPMEVKSVQPAEKPGFSVVTLGARVNFDAVFGSAGVVKNGSEQSGDTHSVLRLSDDKLLMALCDGMGSGERAEGISTLTLNLIENFYRAGFESSLILSSVNKLLALKGEEIFTALDVCIFDLRDCVCDFVKVGSPCGLIKSSDGTCVIEAGALPLGILDEVKPSVASFALKDGDFVVVATDGVVDAFDDIEEFKNFVNNFETQNPQTLADAVVSQALAKCNNLAQDDMTVLIGRVWRKI